MQNKISTALTLLDWNKLQDVAEETILNLAPSLLPGADKMDQAVDALILYIDEDILDDVGAFGEIVTDLALDLLRGVLKSFLQAQYQTLLDDGSL